MGWARRPKGLVYPTKLATGKLPWPQLRGLLAREAGGIAVSPRSTAVMASQPGRMRCRRESEQANGVKRPLAAEEFQKKGGEAEHG